MKLSISNLAKTFNRSAGEANFFYAVKDINMEIDGNNFVEIIGKSGSGKTTLLNIVAGLLNPDEGTVLYDSTDIFSLNDKERSRFRNMNIGVVPQGQTGLQNLTVYENIVLPSLLYDKEDRSEYAKELLKKLDIESLKDSYPNELSGGELRRMVIARALIMNPQIIFADEPTGDLDEENTKKVLEILQNIKNEGKIIFMVTHDKDAAKYADIIYKMDGGLLTECDKDTIPIN